MMTSRVIQYSVPRASDERHVMLFALDWNQSSLTNDRATALLSTAAQPTHLHAPYQGWKFLVTSGTVPRRLYVPNTLRVCGNALVVREKKLDGRWQLVSM